ncbi:hypothetical protein AX16_000078 [Volvariella volvacea WC 439]|nr:hypothetical protein AX16_000078 [Volvariella volvacea WC 439]
MSTSSYSGKLFLLGGAGYVGAEFLLKLQEQYPDVYVVALLRNATVERKASLTQLYPNASVVEGSLSDTTVIREQTSQADITVNLASGGEGPFLDAILAGLEDASKQRPGNPPIYIHISGYGILSDNVGGEPVKREKIPKYTDSTFNINDVPPTNIHVESNKAVVAAGERKDVPIKTMILFPCWIYGVGAGPQKITLAFRFFFNLARAAGHAVTLGPGLNIIPSIHVKDIATSIVAMIRGALDGTAETGAQGVYFAGQDIETAVTLKDIMDVTGNTLYELGLVSQRGSQPASPQLRQSIPEDPWSIFGGNAYGIPERLRKLGVEFTETKKTSLLESLPEEIKIAAKEWA